MQKLCDWRNREAGLTQFPGKESRMHSVAATRVVLGESASFKVLEDNGARSRTFLLFLNVRTE